jgi:hypothetical protein
MKTDFIKANFNKNYGIEERSLKETEFFEKGNLVELQICLLIGFSRYCSGA